VSGLSPARIHYFAVRARDIAGNRDSNTSQVHEATMPIAASLVCTGVIISNSCYEISPFYAPAPAKIARLPNNEFVVSNPYKITLDI